MMEELSVGQFKERVDGPNVVVLDTRSYHAFAGQHIAGAWHLDLNGNFPAFAGWVLPTDKDILLVADDYEKGVEANTWARRVGMDRIVGYLDGGMAAWAAAGFRTESLNLISAEDLHAMITGAANVVLVDVRAPQEYEDSHIKGAINIPVADLRTRHKELNKDKKTVLICSGRCDELDVRDAPREHRRHTPNSACACPALPIEVSCGQRDARTAAGT